MNTMQASEFYIRKMQNILQDPINIEPEQLCQFISMNSYLGVNDYVLNLISHSFSPSNLCINYIYLFDCFVKYKMPLPADFTHMLVQAF